MVSKENILIPALLPFEEEKISAIDEKLKKIIDDENWGVSEKKKAEALLLKRENELKKQYGKLTNWQKTQVSRHVDRPYCLDYISMLFDDFIEFHGDRLYGDDAAIVGGFARFNGSSVCVVGNQKGRGTKENMHRNFGMSQPEGYRKALRLFQLADKFNKPIITFVDTPGAYPGIEAEKHGQGEAIAKNLQKMFAISVPIIVFVIGEGGSGGALALAVGNSIHMLEHAVYSVISPESCASILWRDVAFREDAAAALRNDAETAKQHKLIDTIIKEPIGGAHRDPKLMAEKLKKILKKDLLKYSKLSRKQIMDERIEKFSNMGVFIKAKI